MSFNKIALIAVISFYVASQTFGLDSIIESNSTVQIVSSCKVKYNKEF